MAIFIGFANQYYTLWEVTEENKPKYEVIGGQDIFEGTHSRTHYHFFQNLSKDLDEAKKKAEKMFPDVEIKVDKELRGQSFYSNWAFTGISESEIAKQYPNDVFTFGVLRGVKFSKVGEEDAWQLVRATQEEKNMRNRYHAHKRLVELGIRDKVAVLDFDGSIKEYKWFDWHNRYYNKRDINYTIYSYIIENAEDGFFFEEGDKVELEVTCIGWYEFESRYGYTTKQTFVTSEGKKFYYMGSKPVDCSKWEKLKLKGTIKHNLYYNNRTERNVNETKLQRIKLLESNL